MFPAMLDGIERDMLRLKRVTANVGEYQIVGRAITMTFIRRVLLGNGRLPTAITASNL